MTDKSDEAIDGVLASPKFWADLKAAKTEDDRGRVKTLRLAGIPVTIKRENDLRGKVVYRAKVDRTPFPKEEESPGELKGVYPDRASFWGDLDKEEEVFTRAMDWADKRAHANAVAHVASLALSAKPDIVLEPGDDIEYYQDLAELADQGGKIDERLYIADITEWLDSEELGPNRGGRWTISCLPSYEIEVRCELVLCFEAGGRWLAVYEVEAI